jgi:AcrR family transcriptional regulator
MISRRQAASVGGSESADAAIASTAYELPESRSLSDARRVARQAAVAEPSATEHKILQGAMLALARQGSRTLSMSDIADCAHVSRGTLYRYFSTKEEVLSAVSEYISSSFERRLRVIDENYSDPLERLEAVMALQLELANEKYIARIAETDPGHVQKFLRSHFDRQARAMKQVLTPLFDLIEQRSGVALDRDVFAAALLRVNLSTVVIPADAHWDTFPQVLTALLRMVMTAKPATKVRSRVRARLRRAKKA